VERPAGLHEEHLCLAWERQMVQPERLVTAAGDRLHVIYPGRRCGDPGPDFRDAVIALPDATVLHGDVEVHLDRAGWAAHGHAANPAYDRVILHLTWATAEQVQTSAGGAVVGVALLPCLAIPVEALVQLPVRYMPPPGASCPCAVPVELLPTVPAFLQAQGMARLAGRAASMAADAAVDGYDQTLWSALLRGLGYQRNVAPFAHLARLVRWSSAALLAGRASGRADLTALLLGAAGLLEPPSRPLPAPDETARQGYEARWLLLKAYCADRPLHRNDWTAAGVRPDNAPARRIAAAAGLACTYAAGLSAACIRAVATAGQPVHLVAEDDPFWCSRADFGRQLGPEPVTLLGVARERELLVNVVLPGVLAMAGESDDAILEQAVRDRYLHLGAAGPNQITRHMLRTIGATGRQAASAAAEQGLLHLYHRWCRERRCWECPLPPAFVAHAPGNADALEPGVV
jgi:hypothetical protein